LRCLLPARHLAAHGYDSKLLGRVRIGRPDVVVFQKAYAAPHLDLAARLKARGARLVLDVCDNHFYNPTGSPEYAARADRLRRMIELADVVTASTRTLADVIEHPRCVVVDDFVEWPDELAAPRADSDPFRLLWFGNAGDPDLGFGMCDLGGILEAIAPFAEARPVELVVSSNSAAAYGRWIAGAPFPTRYEAWSPRSFQQLARRAHVSVLPITLNPFTAAKTANRVVTSILHGLPVVAGAVPSYAELGDFLLFDDWERNLRRYADDAELRAAHVANGQRFIAERFADRRIVSQWVDALGLQPG
jgi:hypothetical protein